MKFKTNLLAAIGLSLFPVAVTAQFVDRFSTIDPAWTINRYAPAGFASVVFGGDSRLQLTIDQTGSTANRDITFSSPFYSTQGFSRPGGITGLWTISAQVYVSSAFDTTTGVLANNALWGHTGTTGAGGDYAILGFTNDSPTDTLNASATDRAFRFQAFDGNTGSWFNLGVPTGFVFDAWHTLSEVSTGNSFEYYIDGNLVLTNTTAAGNDLLSVMIQGYNFGLTDSYSTYWDNLTVSAIPEPATYAAFAGLGALGLAVTSESGRQRKIRALHKARDKSYTPLG